MIIPYPKVVNLGSSGSENALVGEVVLQEKVDGSQFRWGYTQDGDIEFASHHASMYYPVDNKLFKAAVEYLYKLEKTRYPRECTFFAECLSAPKHNALTYEFVPKHNLMLFDVYIHDPYQPGWANRNQLEEWAYFFDIDVAPELYRGTIEMLRVEKSPTHITWTGYDFLKNIVGQTMSFLGGTTIEGVVIKNYNQMHQIGPHIWPVFTKYVSPMFREKNEKAQKEGKVDLIGYFNSFCTEARWQKAIAHLKEQGILLNDVKDIGPLIQEVHKDISEEEKENINHFLYKYFIRQILGASTKGFAEWYKQKLMENMYG